MNGTAQERRRSTQDTRAQRRRANRSTAISATTSTTITTNTQIHSTAMVRLPPGAAAAERDGVTPARRWLPARNGLHASRAGGTLHPPAPAVCLLDGLPPRPLRGQGVSARQEAPARHTVDRSRSEAARRHRSPRAGEEQSPTSRQEGRTVADQLWDPTPPAPADPRPGRRSRHRPDRHRDQPAPSRGPRRAGCPTPPSPSPAT